ncbi:Hypothetical protein NocV09_03900010 [Nannochloropsis oceanica]
MDRWSASRFCRLIPSLYLPAPPSLAACVFSPPSSSFLRAFRAREVSIVFGQGLCEAEEGGREEGREGGRVVAMVERIMEVLWTLESCLLRPGREGGREVESEVVAVEEEEEDEDEVEELEEEEEETWRRRRREGGRERRKGAFILHLWGLDRTYATEVSRQWIARRSSRLSAASSSFPPFLKLVIHSIPPPFPPSSGAAAAAAAPLSSPPPSSPPSFSLHRMKSIGLVHPHHTLGQALGLASTVQQMSASFPEEHLHQQQQQVPGHVIWVYSNPFLSPLLTSTFLSFWGLGLAWRGGREGGSCG